MNGSRCVAQGMKGMVGSDSRGRVHDADVCRNSNIALTAFGARHKWRSSSKSFNYGAQRIYRVVRGRVRGQGDAVSSNRTANGG
jgi:hypothetical protein